MLLRPSPRRVDSLGHVVLRLLPASRRLPNVGDKVQKAAMLLNTNGAAWEKLAEVWPASDLNVTALQPAVPTISA